MPSTLASQPIQLAPQAIAALTEPTSIAFVQQLQTVPVSTELHSAPIQTAYVRSGAVTTAPPLLLIHGFDSSVLEFRRLLPHLAAHCETWAVDLLGFGFTDRPTHVSYSPATIKTHLYATWQQLIQRPVVLVGASMGGAAAIDFALTYPEAVAQLVLLDSAGFAAGPAMGRLMIPPLDRWATNFLRNPKVRQKISEKAYCDRTGASRDAQRCAALHLAQPRWAEALISFTKSGGYNFLSQRITDLEPETIVIWGEQDAILGTADASRFRKAIRRSRLVWIPNCGHVPHLEQPTRTADIILPQY